jgi:hypothetical protein
MQPAFGKHIDVQGRAFTKVLNKARPFLDAVRLVPLHFLDALSKTSNELGPITYIH